jgi:hypothetical protein
MFPLIPFLPPLGAAANLQPFYQMRDLLRQLIGRGAGKLRIVPRMDVKEWKVQTVPGGDIDYLAWPWDDYFRLKAAWDANNKTATSPQIWPFGDGNAASTSISTYPAWVALGTKSANERLGAKLALVATVDQGHKFLTDALTKLDPTFKPASESITSWIVPIAIVGAGLFFITRKRVSAPMSGSSDKPKNPRQRVWYKTCEFCEMNFKLPYGETTLPPHKTRTIASNFELVPCEGSGSKGV